MEIATQQDISMGLENYTEFSKASLYGVRVCDSELTLLRFSDSFSSLGCSKLGDFTIHLMAKKQPILPCRKLTWVDMILMSPSMPLETA